MGVGLDTLAIARVQSGDISGLLTNAPLFDAIIIDPIIGLDESMRIVDFMTTNIHKLSIEQTSYIMVNQLREDISSKRQVAPLGRTFHHFMSIRIFIKKKDLQLTKDEIIGYKLNCDVLKNKIAPTTGAFTITIPYGRTT
jgi:hypothetical protein